MMNFPKSASGVLDLNEGFCLSDMHGILLSLQTHKSIFDKKKSTVFKKGVLQSNDILIHYTRTVLSGMGDIYESQNTCLGSIASNSEVRTSSRSVPPTDHQINVWIPLVGPNSSFSIFSYGCTHSGGLSKLMYIFFFSVIIYSKDLKK